MPPSERDVRRQTPPGGVSAEPKPGEEPLETMRLARAARDTSRIVVDRVDGLRGEVNKRFVAVEQRFGVVEEQIGDLRQTTGEVVGKLDILVDELRSDRDERRQMRITDVQARIDVVKTEGMAAIEVNRTAQLAAISEKQKDNQLKRDAVMLTVTKVLAGCGLVWALISSLIMAGRC